MAAPAAMTTGAAFLYASPSVAYAKEATPATSKVDVKKVRDAIKDVMDTDMDKRGDGTSLYGTMIRLAWHCAGTYAKDDDSGGSNGARMRFSPEKDWGANAGLQVARDALEPVKAKYPDISYADCKYTTDRLVWHVECWLDLTQLSFLSHYPVYTLAGVVAVEEAGGPEIPFRLGRVDFESGATSPPDGRLPDADKGSGKKTIEHVREVFYRMGFTDKEIVALLGAHAMGRCHTDASGYWGPWTFAGTYFVGFLYVCSYLDYLVAIANVSPCYFSQRIPFPTNTIVFLSRNAGHPRRLTMERRGQARISLRTRRES